MSENVEFLTMLLEEKMFVGSEKFEGKIIFYPTIIQLKIFVLI